MKDKSIINSYSAMKNTIKKKFLTQDKHQCCDRSFFFWSRSRSRSTEKKQSRSRSLLRSPLDGKGGKYIRFQHKTTYAKYIYFLKLEFTRHYILVPIDFEEKKHFKIPVLQPLSRWLKNASSYTKEPFDWCGWRESSVVMQEQVA